MHWLLLTVTEKHESLTIFLPLFNQHLRHFVGEKAYHLIKSKAKNYPFSNFLLDGLPDML